MSMPVTASRPLKDGTARSPHPIIQKLADARVKQQVSQEEMAVLIGQQQNILSRYEIGRTTPGLVPLLRWANALGYDLVLRPLQKKTLSSDRPDKAFYCAACGSRSSDACLSDRMDEQCVVLNKRDRR